MRFYFIFFFLLLSLACSEKPTGSDVNKTISKTNANSAKTAANLPVYTYEIVNTYPHDPKAFTEGLFYYNGFLYESTGQEGRSDLRKVDLNTGKTVQRYALPSDSFGEGATVFEGKIYQLTWQEGRAFVYDANNLKLLKQFVYQGEGWGMTNDGTNLIMSDGTHILKYIDPETFKVVRTVGVLQNTNNPLFLLNELEYVKGEIWANIWHSEDKQTGTTQGVFPNLEKPNYMARIDPNSGKLLGWIDLNGISPEDVQRDSENTLNGIAYDASNDRIFVTGKNWKKLFEIKVKPK